MNNITQSQPPSPVDQQSIYRRVTEEFACDHPRVVLTRFVKSNNTSEFRRQCLECGANVGCVRRNTLTEADLDVMPAWDKGIGERRSQAWNARYTQLQTEAKEAQNREWQEWFQAYLRSPRWARKRQAVLDRDEGLCQGCRNAPAYQAHHLTYAHAGNELLFELISLCRACHERAHGLADQ